MKVEFNKKFLSLIQLLSFSNEVVQFVVKDDTLFIVAHSEDLYVKIPIPKDMIVSDKGNFDCLSLPVNSFTKLVKMDLKEIDITSTRLNFKDNSGGKGTLKFVDHYPIERLHGELKSRLSMSLKQFEISAYPLFSAATKLSEGMYCGIHWKSDGDTFNAIAVDRSRNVFTASRFSFNSDPFSVIAAVTSKVNTLMSHASGIIVLGLCENGIQITNDNFTLIMNVYSGNFPQLEKHGSLNKPSAVEIVLEKSIIAPIVNSLNGFSEFFILELDQNEKLTIRNHNGDIGNYSSEVSYKQLTGDEFACMFSCNEMKEILSRIKSDEFTLYTDGASYFRFSVKIDDVHYDTVSSLYKMTT